MKLKDSFITYENGSDNILMDASSGFSGLVHSNKSAAFIIECLKTEITESEIIAKMLEKYDASEEAITDGVRDVIKKLKSINALENE